MNQKEFVKVINDGKTKEIKSLQAIAKALENLNLPNIKKFSFRKTDISDNKKISDLIKKKNFSNKGKWIYVFCANINLSKLLSEFKNKKEKGNKAFSRANTNVDNPNCVYVGSSNDKLAKRMAEHFGKVNDSTYAIRFNEWLPNNEEITCFYFEVETDSQDVLQHLENGVWENLKPILGKKGGR